MAVTEADLMRQIMVALSEDGHFVARANVGLFYTRDLRPVSTGLPPGFSDIFGHRASDARAFYIEIKTPTGRASPQQLAFIAAMQKRGAIAGVARSVAEARALLL
jgi:VRR-NUC domain